MPKNADNVASVAIRDQPDRCIPDTAAGGDNREKLYQTVIGCSRRRENHARREGKGDGGGSNQGSSAPFLEYFQR